MYWKVEDQFQYQQAYFFHTMKFETTSYHFSRAWNTKFLQKKCLWRKNTITINIIIIIIIIVILIVVNIIDFIIIIIIVYRLPLVPTLFEALWDEENTL